ncbi:GAF domain-containing protein [Candidatus Zixiibacteriota bacterium]
MSEQNRTVDRRRKKRVAPIMDHLHSELRARIEDLLKAGSRRREHTLSVNGLLEMLTRLAQADKLETLLSDAAKTAAELCGAAGAAISTVKTHQADKLGLFRYWGLEPAEPDDLIFAADGPLVTAAREAAGPLVVADMVGKLGPRSKKRAVLRRLGCEVVLPLIRHERVGGLLLLTGHADGNHLTDREIELLVPYATCLAMALENILLSPARPR